MLFPAFIALLLISTAISGLLLLRLLPRRQAPGADAMMLAIIADAFWAITYAFEIAARTLESKLFWAQMQFIGIALIPVAIFFFAIIFTGNRQHIGQTRMVWISAPALLTLLLVFTNPLHHQIWSNIEMPSGGGIGPLQLDHGLWFWSIYVPYTYLLMLIATLLIARLAYTTQGIYRRQAVIMLVGLLCPWIGNMIYLSGLVGHIDLTPLAFMFTNIIVAIGFLQHGLMEILPVAHSLVFASIKDGVVVIDSKDRIVELNPAASAIFLDKNSGLVGKNIQTLFPDWAQWQVQANADGEFQSEYSLDSAGGKTTYTIESTGLKTNRRQAAGRIILMHNITALRKANEDIEIANRLKSQLLANFSHDLRGPLGAVIGYADMLGDELFGPINDEQKNAAQEIQDSANTVLAFVNNLIGQAQFETGKMLLRESIFPLSDLISPLLSTLRFHAGKKGLDFSYEIDPALPAQMRGDSFWLRQIILNLVHNAQKFTDKGSVNVFIGLTDESHWHIRVSDTGIGIPAEDQERIFRVFEQSSNITDRRQTGFGLGLSIVANLTAMMNGKIQLESQPGKGSEFKIILPLKSA